MTAYELADWLDNFSSVNDGDGNIMSEISEKLRGQRAEIDNLTSIKYVNGVTISKLYAELNELKTEVTV